MDGDLWCCIRSGAWGAIMGRRLPIPGTAAASAGPGGGVFVFEEYKDFAPVLRPDAFDPLGELRLGVSLFAEADVTPIGGADELWQRAVVGFGGAEGGLVLSQAGVDVVREPAFVLQLQDDRRPAGDVFEECLEPRQVLFEIRRQLEQQRALRLPSSAARLTKSSICSSAFTRRRKWVIVCRALSTKRNDSGSVGGPRLDGFFRGEAAKGAVDFDGRKLRRVVGEHLLGGQLLPGRRCPSILCSCSRWCRRGNSWGRLRV